MFDTHGHFRSAPDLGEFAGSDRPIRGPYDSEAPRADPVAQVGVFRKEGEYWTVGLAGKAARLGDAKGLGYLAYLLRHPAVEFHVLDLTGGIASGSDEQEPYRPALSRENLQRAGMHVGSLGDAGELLDDHARRNYRRRLLELQQELEESKALARVERAEKVEAEIDALTRELSRAIGLGGRGRRAASASERARQAVTKAIGAAIGKIARNNDAMAQVLARDVRTGTFCSYQPDSQLPIKWELAAGLELQQTTIPSVKTAPANVDYVAASPAQSGVFPPSKAQRTPFVSREYESSALRAAIERARYGTGSFVMLRGGPGIGKTRLATEMAEHAARNGFACLSGCCYEREETVPYLPFVQAIEAMLDQAPSPDKFRRQIGDNAPELAELVPRLRRVFPDIREPLELPPAQKRRCLFQSICDLLAHAAQEHPHLLILEDLQWADESTLALLTHMANRIGRCALVIIGTYRDECSEDNPALVRTLEELIRQGVRPLKLVGLSKDSVAQMLRELSRSQTPESLANAIFEQTNGNPFLVEEVYWHLIDRSQLADSTGQFRSHLKIDDIDVPDSVRLVIARRLRYFSEPDTLALSAAAVIGRSFSFQLLAAISKSDVPELLAVVDRAQRMGMIVPSSQEPQKSLAFANELVRQTLLGNLSVARRQQLHARLVTEFERLYPDAVNEHAEEMTDHLLKAGSFADSRLLARLTNRAKNAGVADTKEARANVVSLSRVVGSS